ncbi:MAG: DUF6265 family protein [Chitinophagaceae bacterium]
MIKVFTGLCLLVLVISLQVFAQTTKPGSVSDIKFIEGHWKANADGRTVEGVWLAPEGNNILGFMRMMTGGKASLYEILAYEQSDQGLVSLVKHFRPGLLGVEEKDRQDRYNFLEAGTGRAVFEKQGEALRILYEKRSADQFVIARGNLQEGKWVFKDLFVFDRVK